MDRCLSLDEIFDYIERKLPLAELSRIEQHIMDCSMCRNAIEGTIKLGEDRETVRKTVEGLCKKVMNKIIKKR